MANLYAQKLKNLSDQINIMLMEAEGDQPDLSNSFEQIQNYVSRDPKNETRVLWLKASGIYKKVEDAVNEKASTPTEGEVAAGDDTKTYGIKSAILAFTALAVSAVGTLNFFAKGLDEVKKMTDLALNSSNYQEFSKSVKALQKISSDTSLWSKLTVSSSAKELATSNVGMIKKGYIAAGVAMILVSVILILLTGSALDVIGSIKDAITSLDIKSIMAAVGKMVAIGALSIPAIIGAVLIIIAVKGFNDGDTAAKVAGACYPVMKVINVIIAKIIEVSQNAARNKVQSIKKMKALKK